MLSKRPLGDDLVDMASFAKKSHHGAKNGLNGGFEGRAGMQIHGLGARAAKNPKNKKSTECEKTSCLEVQALKLSTGSPC